MKVGEVFKSIKVPPYLCSCGHSNTKSLETSMYYCSSHVHTSKSSICFLAAQRDTKALSRTFAALSSGLPRKYSRGRWIHFWFGMAVVEKGEDKMKAILCVHLQLTLITAESTWYFFRSWVNNTYSRHILHSKLTYSLKCSRTRLTWYFACLPLLM